MAKNIYVAGAEQGSGKSAIVLAIMEYLSGHSGKIGFFRPIIADLPSSDSLIRLIATRYGLTGSYASLYGCTQEIARDYFKDSRYDDLLKLILARYQELAKHYDINLGSSSATGSGNVLLSY